MILDKSSENVYEIIAPINKPRKDAISFINPFETPFINA